MTREKAIQILKMNEQEKWRSGITAEEEKEAIDMCIKALQNNDVQVLENRLKHLLKSRYIAKFDEINHATGEYVRNIEDADVCFVCDNKACKVCHPETCKYTSEPKHAINFERNGGAGTFFEKLPDNLHWIEKSGLFICPYCNEEHDTHFHFCGWCGKKVL
ncbi:MAG: hypothetical protein J6V44_08820 [Methanobrevibacter sp.]|nr:hypothetical protein [Methanobrevibacter sp.]